MRKTSKTMVLQTTSRGVRTLATTQSNSIVNAKSGILKKVLVNLQNQTES